MIPFAAQDAISEPSGLFIRSAILGDVPHAVSTRAMTHQAGQREALAVRMRETLGWPAETPIALAEQVHGTEVAVVGEGLEPGSIVWHKGADALLTARQGILLGVFTADCVPVLFADPEAGVFGAVHAGWKGSIGAILPKALQAAFDLGAQPQRLRTWIGPCICGEEYEVSEELAARFADRFPQHARNVVQGRHVDLPMLNALQALDCGLPPANVAAAGLCTRREAARLWSYRADGESAGRMLSAILSIHQPRKDS